MLRKMHPKKLIGVAFEVLIVAVVAIFFAINSFRFWEWTFPTEQWYLAYLGFGLTGGAAIGYLVVFLWRADSSLRKTTALIMMLVCIVGELVTAGFGIQVEIWKRAGYALTQSDFDFMTLVVQALGFVHALAVIVYYVGDNIAEMFGDADGDGIPNYRDRDYKPNTRSSNQSTSPQNANRMPQDARGSENRPRPSSNGHKPAQQEIRDYRQYDLAAFLQAVHMNKDAFSGWMADRDLIGETETREALKNEGLFPSDMSGNNFKKLFYQMFPQNERRANF